MVRPSNLQSLVPHVQCEKWKAEANAHVVFAHNGESVRGVSCDSLDLVHALDSGISLILVREAHEAEATAASGVTVLDDNLNISDQYWCL